jgi:hypothetical protein
VVITEVPVHLTLPGSATPRSEGVHLSGIIRSIAAETGFLKAGWVEDLSIHDRRLITDPVAILRMMIGLAWEQFYIQRVLVHEGVVDHPDEMHNDDIFMSPDAEQMVSMVLRSGKRGIRKKIHEIKATYKSTNTVGDVYGEWMWLTQLKGYCHSARTLLGELHVLFLCGDYSMPIKPIAKRWAIEFTQEELDRNWQLMCDYKAHREEIDAQT